jgi:hypothetical protein
MLSWLTATFLFPFIWPGLLTGVVLLIASKLLPPLFAQQKIAFLLAGFVLVLGFTFLAGKESEYSSHLIAIAETNAENARLSKKSADISTAAAIQYVEKIKYVDRWKEVKVDRYVTKDADNACVISDTTAANISGLYNDSIKGRVPSGPVKLDEKTSRANSAP